jgi:anti-sigma regulatory factor (Ser/Thr protein kinase)
VSNEITYPDPRQRQAQLHPADVDFHVLLSSTRRGARLARLLTVAELASRGLPTETVAQVVAELAANAALHGRVPGRSFRLRVRTYGRHSLLIEVTDARPEHSPESAPSQLPPADAESGRGLVLVEALAERWGVRPGPTPCKTIWAEVALAERVLPSSCRAR